MIEMVHRALVLTNSFPHKGGIYSVLSPREIVTGNKFRCPKIRIGQYVQELVGGTNDTEQERSINTLYLGRTDNSSGCIVFKLNTKAVVSVNRVVAIPTQRTIINQVN